MGTLLEAAKFGWQNPLCARWNSPEQLLNWREAWASAVNRALEEKQQSARVTHLSHTALGLDEQLTAHEGSQARKLEMQGIFFLDLTYEEYVWNIPLYSVAFILRLLAIFSIALLIQKYHQPLSVGKQSRAWVPLSAVFPISTLLIIWQIYTFPHEQQIWQICLLILNVVDVVAILLLDHLEQSAINREKLVAAAERAHVQDENIEALSQAYAGQRKMTHDYRAQLSTLSELVDQGNLAEVKAFLSEMKDHQSERILLINTHNAAIDAVLNQKDYAGQRQGIDMRFRVNNQYLVISGEESLPDINTSSQYVATGEKQYVLMSQEDYWNGLVTNASPAQ